MRKVRQSRGSRTALTKRVRRELWSAEKARIRRGGRRRLRARFQGKIITKRLRAPASLGMANAGERDQLFKFLHEMRLWSERPGVRLIIDFSGARSVNSAGGVFLIAELDRALQSGGAVIQGTRSKTPLVEEVFQQIGIYQKLGLKCDVAPSSDSVIHWRVASGTLAEGSAGGSILEEYEGILTEGLTRGLYDGVVEAMTNTVHHAYPDTNEGRLRRHKIGRRWWMLSQEKDGTLTVAICDLGVGIPKSLPRSRTYSSETLREFWRNTGLDRSDGSAISVAVQLGRSRTGEKQRGHGLADILEAVKLSPGGRVLITSNRGILTSREGKDSVHNHSRSANGTLVHWSIPVSPESVDG